MEKHSEITDDFLNLIKSNGRQAKFLEFFKIMQLVNDEILIINQKVVLNLLFDPQFKHNALYLLKDTKESVFE